MGIYGYILVYIGIYGYIWVYFVPPLYALYALHEGRLQDGGTGGPAFSDGSHEEGPCSSNSGVF